MLVDILQLAQRAYEAYADHQRWQNYAGGPIPPWAGMRADIKEAWAEAVEAVLDGLDEAEVVGE